MTNTTKHTVRGSDGIERFPYKIKSVTMRTIGPDGQVIEEIKPGDTIYPMVIPTADEVFPDAK